MSTLSSDEKEALANIIEIVYGHDSQIISMKDNFTESTTETVEKMLEAILTCNDSMKALVTSLVGGAGLFTKGWLKRALKGIERQLSNEKLKFDGLACRVNAARNWKTEIILSTYGI
ncbi:MAG: hypothetical protein CSA49_01365 [Gammaproteobacteria bacterium]|nr:MAG: hypothetical protein CSA49_01365 [Gammaproteobacteria bacterium]